MPRLESHIYGLCAQSRDLQTNLHQIGLTQFQSSVEQGATAQGLHQRMGDIQALQQQNDAIQNERLIQYKATVQEPMSRLLTAQKRIQVKLEAVEAAYLGRAAESNLRSTIQSPARNTSTTAVRISTYMSHNQCTDSCTCLCHHRQIRRTPRLLDSFLGALFLGYIGIPYITPQCDNRKCIQRSIPMTLILYLFPSWLTARALILTSKVSSMNGLEFSLRAPRIISPSARIWTCCSQGDIEGMKAVFQQSLGSPFDISGVSGETPLQVSKDRAPAHYMDSLIPKFEVCHQLLATQNV